MAEKIKLVEFDAYDKVSLIGTSPAFTFTRASNANKSDGTLLTPNQPHYEAGKFGEGIMIEGADGSRAASMLTIPAAGILSPAEGAIELYLKRNNAANTYQNVFSVLVHGSQSVNRFSLERDVATDTFFLALADSNGTYATGSPAILLPPDIWHHLAITWGNGVFNAYLNGALLAGCPWTPTYTPSSFDASTFDIGFAYNWAGREINGLIDDLRISNRARTAAEILLNYQSNLPAQWDDNTTALYRFDEPQLKTCRFCTGTGYTTKPTDDPPNTYYEPRVIQTGLYTQDMFSAGTTGGASKIGFGETTLANADGGLDYLIDYAMDGRDMVIKEGLSTASLSAFATITTGTMEQPVPDLTQFSIRLRDKNAIFNTPLQDLKYFGSNVLPLGLDGGEDIKDKFRPIVYGTPKNVVPTMVNTSKLIYHLNDQSTDIETSPNDFSMWWVRPGDSLAGDQFTFASGSNNTIGNQFYKAYTGLAAGFAYEWQAEVMADRVMNLIVGMNSTTAWDSCSFGQVFTLPNGVWQTVSLIGTAPATGMIDLHLGANGQTELAAVVQNAGVVRVRNVRLLKKDPLANINNVFDAGANLTKGADYTDIRDLLLNAPAAGTFRAYPAGGFFRLGSAPTGQITANATQSGYTSQHSVAQIVKKIALRRIQTTDLVQQSFIDLDQKNNFSVSLYDNSGMMMSAALDELCRSVGAWYGFNNLGKFGIYRLEIPNGNAITTLTAAEILSVERLATNDIDRGVPAYRVILDYDKNNTVQTTGLAGSLTQDQRNWRQDAYRTVKAEDLTVLTAHKLSPELHFTTNLTSALAAQIEADRLLTMYKTRRDRLAVTCSLDGLRYPDGGWWDNQTITDMIPSTRSHHVAVIHNNYLYVVGGRVSGVDTTSVIRLDLTNPSGAWDDAGITDLPAVRYRHAAVVHNNYLYVMGGLTTGGTLTASVIRLDLTNPSGAWDDVGVTDLPQSRFGLLAEVYGNYLYVMGGGYADTSVIRLDLTNPAGAWDDVGVTDLPRAIRYSAPVIHNNYLYIVGGYNHASVIRLDLTNPAGAWDDAGVTDLPQTRYDHAAAILNGHLYVMGGFVAGAQSTSVIRLDLTNPSGAWDDVGVTDLPTTRSNLAAVVHNNYIYAIGGVAPDLTQNTYVYRSNDNTDSSSYRAYVSDLGRPIKLKINRFGYAAGKLFTLIGIEVNRMANTIKMNLWG